MLKKIVFLVVIAIFGASARLNFTDCGSHGIIHDIRVRNCLVSPCSFRRGDSYYTEIELTNNAPIALNLPVRAEIVIPILPNIPVFTANGCELLRDGACPKPTGSHITVGIDFEIPNESPTLSVNARFILGGGLGQVTHLCGQIPVNIVD